MLKVTRQVAEHARLRDVYLLAVRFGPELPQYCLNCTYKPNFAHGPCYSLCTRCSLANNNNNSHDNVYSAVIMTKVIARVHPVHLMNVD